MSAAGTTPRRAPAQEMPNDYDKSVSNHALHDTCTDTRVTASQTKGDNLKDYTCNYFTPLRGLALDASIDSMNSEPLTARCDDPAREDHGRSRIETSHGASRSDPHRRYQDAVNRSMKEGERRTRSKSTERVRQAAKATSSQGRARQEDIARVKQSLSAIIAARSSVVKPENVITLVHEGADPSTFLEDPSSLTPFDRKQKLALLKALRDQPDKVPAILMCNGDLANEHAEIIAELIQDETCPLAVVNLELNSISGPGISHIASALLTPGARSLRELMLHGQRVVCGTQAENELASALHDSPYAVLNKFTFAWTTPVMRATIDRRMQDKVNRRIAGGETFPDPAPSCVVKSGVNEAKGKDEAANACSQVSAMRRAESFGRAKARPKTTKTEQALQQAQEKIRSLEQALQQAQEKIRSLEQALQQAQEKIRSLEQALQQAQEKIRSLELDLESVHAQCEVLPNARVSTRGAISPRELAVMGIPV